MSRTLKIGLFSAVLLIILLFVAKKQGWIGSNNKGETVTTEKVKRATISELVSASGKIQPELEIKISSEVSGEIIDLAVLEGQTVKKGDLLAKINPDIYIASVNRVDAAVSSSRAALASTEAQLVEVEKIYNRSVDLKKKGAISQQEFDAAQRSLEVTKLSVESARFQLKSSEANAKEARDNLNRTTLFAPTDGTISLLNVEKGERVVGTAQMTGTELMRVSNLQAMEVLVEVNENDIVRVSLGDTATIEVDAFQDQKFKGVVTQIANSAKLMGTSVDQVTNFEVKIRILPSSYTNLSDETGRSPFRPGMTASVDIQTERKVNILTVPIQAVNLRSDTSNVKLSYRERKERKESRAASDQKENEEYEVVFAVIDGKAKLIVVKTGIQDDQNIELLLGPEEGTEIITGPYSLLSKDLNSGDVVTVKSKEEEE
jgi:HlyD family secretion protein